MFSGYLPIIIRIAGLLIVAKLAVRWQFKLFWTSVGWLLA